ncbi:MAG: hypothetical protein K2P03_11495, partial [Lachnospiraceae bacterium]|nr:hypothetical protein [Lachnospiraceae bacterium]
MRKWLYRLWLAISLPCVLNLVLLGSQKMWKFGNISVLVIWGLIIGFDQMRIREKKMLSLRVRMMRKGGSMIYSGLYAMALSYSHLLAHEPPDHRV